MNFLEVCRGLTIGKAFRRKCWDHPDCQLWALNWNINLSYLDMEAEDWEEVEKDDDPCLKTGCRNLKVVCKDCGRVTCTMTKDENDTR